MSQTTTEPAPPPELFFCCGVDCPGLPYRASDQTHPPECIGQAWNFPSAAKHSIGFRRTDDTRHSS